MFVSGICGEKSGEGRRSHIKGCRKENDANSSRGARRRRKARGRRGEKGRDKRKEEERGEKQRGGGAATLRAVAGPE
eukprot:3397087-Rhodomonas_salina.2